MLLEAHRGNLSLEQLLDAVETEDARPADMSDKAWDARRMEVLQSKLEWIGRKIGLLASHRKAGGWEADGAEKLEGEGQKAVNALRRVIPQLVDLMLQDIERGPNALLFLTPEQTLVWQQHKLQKPSAYMEMLRGLRDLAPQNSAHRLSKRRRDMNHWHHGAVTLFELVEDILGAGSMSANGPAVRFVQAGLAAIGVNITLKAIEAALRRKVVR